jgi:hypothetical protein
MMRRGVVWLLMLAAGSFASPAAAQRQRNPGLLGQMGWVQFSLASGRIVADSPYYGSGMQSSSQGNDHEETLSLEMNGASPVVRYQSRSSQESILLVVTDRSDLSLTREPVGEDQGPRVELTQPPSGPITLLLGHGPTQREVRGATLWHVLLADPAASAAHVLPLLELMEADWNLPETLADLDERLLSAAEKRRPADRDLWSSYVARLGSPRFADRQAADRALRRADAAVAPYLRSLDPSRLDAEQRLRVRRLIAAVERDLEDGSAERIAGWLTWDPAAWALLLARPDEATRRRAAEQVGLLLGRSIDFDPAADESTRTAQIEAIRARLSPP